MSERLRLNALIVRDGMEASRQWARWAAMLYRRSMSDPTHYASQADKKWLFEESTCELETFADSGIVS